MSYRLMTNNCVVLYLSQFQIHGQLVVFFLNPTSSHILGLNMKLVIKWRQMHKVYKLFQIVCTKMAAILDYTIITKNRHNPASLGDQSLY